MSTWVKIKDCITFAPNMGVIVDKSALDLSPEEIKESIHIAYSHIEDEPSVDACCGGTAPLADLGQITFEEHLIKLKDA